MKLIAILFEAVAREHAEGRAIPQHLYDAMARAERESAGNNVCFSPDGNQSPFVRGARDW